MAEIRYTQGPEALSLGELPLVRGEWSGSVADAMADQALLPGRKEEYGFEVRGRAEDTNQAAADVQTSTL